MFTMFKRKQPVLMDENGYIPEEYDKDLINLKDFCSKLKKKVVVNYKPTRYVKCLVPPCYYDFVSKTQSRQYYRKSAQPNHKRGVYLNGVQFIEDRSLLGLEYLVVTNIVSLDGKDIDLDLPEESNYFVIPLVYK